MEIGELYMPNDCMFDGFAGYYWGIDDDDCEILCHKNEIKLYAKDIIMCIEKNQIKKYYNISDKKYIHLKGCICLYKDKIFFLENAHAHTFEKIS